MKITISIKTDDPDKIRDLVRTIVKERTGQEPQIHIVNTPAQLDNAQRAAYNSNIQQLGAT